MCVCVCVCVCACVCMCVCERVHVCLCDVCNVYFMIFLDTVDVIKNVKLSMMAVWNHVLKNHPKNQVEVALI